MLKISKAINVCLPISANTNDIVCRLNYIFPDWDTLSLYF